MLEKLTLNETFHCSCEHTLNTLRYADRVKELGTEEPINGGKLDAEANLEDDTMASEDSDLAQLRHMNDGECSADWYHFQENIAQLQVPASPVRLLIPCFGEGVGRGCCGVSQSSCGKHGAVAATGLYSDRHDK